MEMTRGRGAVKLAQYMQEVMEKSATLQKMTPHRITTEVLSDHHLGREELRVKLKLVRYDAQPVEPGKYAIYPSTLLLEVTEPKDVFPSDDLVAKIMLVS